MRKDIRGVAQTAGAICEDTLGNKYLIRASVIEIALSPLQDPLVWSIMKIIANLSRYLLFYSLLCVKCIQTHI